MSGIAYCCPFVPAELIAACGLRPAPVIPGGARINDCASPTAGMCPYARSFLGEVVSGRRPDAVILTTRCDQMRRTADLLQHETDLPIFLLNLPKTWQTPAAHDLYRDELARLMRFLTTLGGRLPSNADLATTMRRSAAERATKPAQSSEDPPSSGSPPLHNGHVPLALVGGPLLREHLALFDVITTAGGQVVLDATESGERGRPAPFDEHRIDESPLDELARAYFDAIPDVFQCPNTRLHEWLAAQISNRGVRGLIVHRYVWCDLWHAQVDRMRHAFNLPLLDLDHGDGDGPELPRLTNRIEAFLEALR